MKKIIVICLMSIIGLVGVQAQLAKMQALYLLQFAKNTSWPREDSGSPFVITVIGDKDLVSELKTVASSKTIGNRKIEVVSSSSVSGLSKSDIIFLGEKSCSQMSDLLTEQSGKTVLLVAGKKGLCSQGAGISFVPDGGKLNYEISEGNIAKNGLKVTQKIVSLAKQVL